MLLLVSTNSRKIFFDTFSLSYVKLLQRVAIEQVCLIIDNPFLYSAVCKKMK